MSKNKLTKIYSKILFILNNKVKNNKKANQKNYVHKLTIDINPLQYFICILVLLFNNNTVHNTQKL